MLDHIKRRLVATAIILIISMVIVPCSIHAAHLPEPVRTTSISHTEYLASSSLIAISDSEDEAEDFQQMSFLPPLLIVLGVFVVGGFVVWLLRRG